ncbi:MAG TPA: PilZ domain-containing protein [Vicinamibacterales bacterium]|jgi:uncharacterized protein (TIGR02266 family)
MMKTVLIATSDAVVRGRFAAAIASAGHEAHVAATAGDLFGTLAAPHAIDLLLLDLRLTAPGGAGLLERIRTDAAMPVVVFSGTVSGAVEVRGLAHLGVAGYVNEHSASPLILPALAPHLFPDNFNRRGSARVLLGTPVACEMGGTLVSAVAADVSRGGLGLRTTANVDIGTAMHVRFRLPGQPGDLDADACVVWSDPRLGCGLQFTGLDPEARRAVDAFVDANS